MTKENELIYQTLAQEIITMKIKPGTMLKEVDVASRFNVSRTPIRDVFKRLEYDKLIDIHSQKGSYVAKINLDGITDIMYIRDQVEFAVLSELSKIITPGDIVKLRMIINDQKALVDSGAMSEDSSDFAQKFYELDNTFHELIYRRAGKETVLQIMNSTYPSFARYRFMTNLRDRSAVENLVHLHEEIVDCLEKKDEAMLSDVVRRHNFSGLNGIEGVRAKHPEYFE
jgi:DNA-binding GntR family transcriptional regulator